MIGLRRQIRAGLATVLAGTASVLQVAASVAETVAQELRLTLPQPDGGAGGVEGLRDTDGGGSRATPSLTDVTAGPNGTGTRAPGADEAPGGTAPADEAPFVPAGRDVMTDVTEAEGEAVAGSIVPEDVTPEAPTRRAREAPTGRATMPDQPAPWVDDVAASVAGGTVREATARLPELSPTQLRAVERYERSHAGRVTLLRAIDTELALREG